MSITEINNAIISQINKGNEKAFSFLYDAYYTYLNAVALCYVFDKNTANEIVNDVFIHIWYKRDTLSFPIHAYLVRSVQNGSLNHIRAQYAQDKALTEHKNQLLAFQEEYILSTPNPLQYVEMQEVEAQIKSAVNQLPEKCRIIFEYYFYNGKSPEDIASLLGLNINTVRVQLKNAMDKLKISLGHLISFLFFILYK